MKVVAIKVGFYGGARKRVGDEFDVPQGMKATWFVPAAEAPAPEPEAKQQPVALSQLGKGSDAPQTFVSAHAGKTAKGKAKASVEAADSDLA
jgi:hypothetical protein